MRNLFCIFVFLFFFISQSAAQTKTYTDGEGHQFLQFEEVGNSLQVRLEVGDFIPQPQLMSPKFNLGVVNNPTDRDWIIVTVTLNCKKNKGIQDAIFTKFKSSVTVTQDFKFFFTSDEVVKIKGEVIPFSYTVSIQ